MKFLSSVLITGVLCSLGSNAFADFKVFRGIAKWNTRGSFNSFDQRGIAMDSIERALSACTMAGMRFCVIKGTALDEDEQKGKRRYISITALVHGYASEPVGKVISFSNTNSVSTGKSELTPLNLFSAKGTALDRALELCYEQFEFCAVSGVKTTETNNPKKEEGITRYYTSAEAKVVGIQSFLEPAIGVTTVVSETIAAPKE